MKRVTITLPDEIVEEIDLRESNRSRFLMDAAVRELARRRAEELRRSLETPHLESARIAEEGLAGWGSLAAAGDDDLLDPAASRPVRWIPGEGFREERDR